MFNLNKKLRICRLYNEDMWGLLRLNQRQNQTFIQFVKQYKERKAPSSPFSRVVVFKRNKRRSLYGEILLFRRKLSTFYGGVRLIFGHPNFRGSLLPTVYSIPKWETSLSSLLYRSHFSGGSILLSIILILSGSVLVNKEVIRRPQFLLKPGDLFELINSYKEEAYSLVIKRGMEGKLVPFQVPYLEVNLVTLSGLLLYTPSYKELYYPFTTGVH